VGCDIHTRVEVNRNINGKKSWVCGDLYKKNIYYKGYPQNHEEYDGDEFEVSEVFGDRNYTAFTHLAGVRDYTGKFEPIQRGRGLPEDATDDVKAKYDYWGCDAHSAGWVTLAEIIQFRKNLKPTAYSGLVTDAGLKQIEEQGYPNSWCQGSSSPMNYAEWEMLEDPLKELEQELRNRLNNLRMAYSEEQQNNQSENIRLIFWFDN